MTWLKIGNRYVNTDNVIAFEVREDEYGLSVGVEYNFAGYADAPDSGDEQHYQPYLDVFADEEAKALRYWLDSNGEDVFFGYNIEIANKAALKLKPGGPVRVKDDNDFHQWLRGLVCEVVKPPASYGESVLVRTPIPDPRWPNDESADTVFLMASEFDIIENESALPVINGQTVPAAPPLRDNQLPITPITKFKVGETVVVLERAEMRHHVGKQGVVTEVRFSETTGAPRYITNIDPLYAFADDELDYLIPF